jgi:hypothetical protein
MSNLYKDQDGHVLKFKEIHNEEMKQHFMSQYPRVDEVLKKRLYCTSCNKSFLNKVGTLIAQNEVRTHKLLGVSQCLKCFKFYVSSVCYRSFMIT